MYILKTAMHSPILVGNVSAQMCAMEVKDHGREKAYR